MLKALKNTSSLVISVAPPVGNPTTTGVFYVSGLQAPLSDRNRGHIAFERHHSRDLTSFVFTDNEKELDVLELSITYRNLQFCDDPLFQEGNEIVV